MLFFANMHFKKSNQRKKHSVDRFWPQKSITYPERLVQCNTKNSTNTWDAQDTSCWCCSTCSSSSTAQLLWSCSAPEREFLCWWMLQVLARGNALCPCLSCELVVSLVQQTPPVSARLLLLFVVSAWGHSKEEGKKKKKEDKSGRTKYSLSTLLYWPRLNNVLWSHSFFFACS